MFFSSWEQGAGLSFSFPCPWLGSSSAHLSYLFGFKKEEKMMWSCTARKEVGVQGGRRQKSLILTPWEPHCRL